MYVDTGRRLLSRLRIACAVTTYVFTCLPLIPADKKKHSKLETKASSHEGQCIPAGYCHAHRLLCATGVNYNVNSKYTKYFAQAAEFLRFGIFPPQINDSCGATYRWNCNTFSALQSTSAPLTHSQTVSKSVHNWRRYPSSNWNEIELKNAVLNLALCCGAIWRHREKPQHRCTTTVHPVYNCSKRFWKIYLL